MVWFLASVRNSNKKVLCLDGFECLKSELVIEQMGQNVWISDIVGILDIKHFYFGQLGSKLFGLGPNSRLLPFTELSVFGQISWKF